MKCKVTRDDVEISPDYAPQIGDDRKEVRPMRRNGRQVFVPFWRKGAVIENPDAWKLVRQGCAYPDDQECAAKCAMNGAQMDAAHHAYERVKRGILPEDYDKFDAGIIEGYLDGEYIPGPNWHLLHGPESTEDEQADYQGGSDEYGGDE